MFSNALKRGLSCRRLDVSEWEIQHFIALLFLLQSNNVSLFVNVVDVADDEVRKYSIRHSETRLV